MGLLKMLLDGLEEAFLEGAKEKEKPKAKKKKKKEEPQQSVAQPKVKEEHKNVSVPIKKTFSAKDLRRAVIWREILGPPKSRR